MNGGRYLNGELKTPSTAKCRQCNHSWTGFYVPMELGRMALLLKNIQCPLCGAGADKIFLPINEMEISLKDNA